jgi:hypothetical protein
MTPRKVRHVLRRVGQNRARRWLERLLLRGEVATSTTAGNGDKEEGKLKGAAGGRRRH